MPPALAQAVLVLIVGSIPVALLARRTRSVGLRIAIAVVGVLVVAEVSSIVSFMALYQHWGAPGPVSWITLDRAWRFGPEQIFWSSRGPFGPVRDWSAFLPQLLLILTTLVTSILIGTRTERQESRLPAAAR